MYIAEKPFSDVSRKKESPSRSQRKVGGAKRSVPIFKGSAQLGCASQDSYPRETIPVNLELWERNTPSNSPKELDTKSKFGKERVHREVLSNSVRFMSVGVARPNSGKDHMTRLCTEKDALAKQRGIWRKIFTRSSIRTKLRSILYQRTCGAKKKMNLRRDEHSTKVQNFHS